ncbi:uncharacterized protein LOC129800825 [Phlebotomus papatasi]|uniref:uncharacterized protein LOC129800825 n=1 Tax=Phlebotomus papatasi TaxID=29031 RepID=UPI0024842DB2|nr:uncharacterized protein LOC129800825 [Phlebotomus papatasi]
MSEHLESPGFADAKMDISSETTSQSQESPGVTSPDDDGNTFHEREIDSISVYEDTKTENTKELSSSVSKNQSYMKTGLTLASNHPLMSPAMTDSDSENSHNHKSISKTSRFAYPDVVPVNESQRHKTTRTTRPATSSEKKVKSTIPIKLENLDIVDNPIGCRKASAFRDLSPDKMASSGSEQDLSQYHASVTPSFQSVALMSRPLPTSSNEQRNQSKCIQDALSDVSSVESFSNRSFDDDFNPNAISGSPTSSLFDNNISREDIECTLDDQLDYPTIAPDSTHTKQKIIMPDGKTREIDMKVIEPYKRVLSHGGYLKTAGHNAIIIFSACYLPDRSRTDYHYVMDSLFLYVVQTLDQLVTDDYVIIYLHGGSCRNNVPPFNWLRKCYQLLDRRLRKSLKTLYMVHPTFWLKSLVLMSRPFISSKFWRKLIYIKNLEDLYTKVPVEKTAIPEKVKQYNSKCV